ncbi:MAG: pseudouridine-5-phosphate glycosidase, partial [Gammaproteobacteria bacterium]
MQYLDIAPEVASALQQGKPVVALESTIIAHGMPYPDNVATGRALEQAIREEGAIPATIAIINGKMKAGLSSDELEWLGKPENKIAKASRRDLPWLLMKKLPGATTVAATMLIAEKAGISIFATGG